MDEAPAQVTVVALGCKLNRSETETIAASLAAGGWVVSDDPVRSRAVVVDTCAVTAEADHKARKAVRRALRDCDGPVVVTGCGASLDPASLRALGGRVSVEPDKSALPGLVARLTGGPSPMPGVRSGEGFRARAAIKVQDGCDTGCAYCVVPLARGGSRSVPCSRVVEEARTLAASGVSELVLTGVNLGSYHDEGVDLAGLVRAVAAVSRVRIRLSSIEPLHLTDRLLHTLAECDVCEHLHVPLQSGSDAVLGAMGRGYTAAEYLDAVSRAKAALPGLALTTDVMAGFPGESDQDAARTLEMLVECAFARAHVFRFSARPGTRAAASSGRVPDPVVRERAEAMSKQGHRSRSAWLQGLSGRSIEVLVERASAGYCEGTSREYARARFQRDGAGVGDIVRLAVDGSFELR